MKTTDNLSRKSNIKPDHSGNINKIISLYKKNPDKYTLCSLAKQFGIAKSTLSYHFKQRKIPLPSRNTRYTEEDKQLWVKLFKEKDLPPTHIAEHPGVKASSVTIRNYLKSLGLSTYNKEEFSL